MGNQKSFILKVNGPTRDTLNLSQKEKILINEASEQPDGIVSSNSSDLDKKAPEALKLSS